MVDNNSSLLLFDRIREKCQRQQWYGPEMNDPA